MSRLLLVMLLAGVLYAQKPVQAEKDPLGRDTPQDSVFHFLETCHARDYSKALHYLDLRNMSPADRAKQGPEIAAQLEDLLDDTPFDITMLSRDPEGDLADGLSGTKERLDTFRVNGQTLELQLERIQPRPGFRIWVVSSDSIPLIGQAHQVVSETAFERKLPQQLVQFEIADTPVWRWPALVILAIVIWILAGLVSWALVMALRRVHAAPFRGPLRIGLAVAGFRAAMELAPPATLARLFVTRVLDLILFMTIAWAGAVVIDVAAERWHSRLDPRAHALSYSVLPLGRQMTKVLIFLFAILSVLTLWGYNTSTILAGLGVGGLAVALAAQKTIENLFGGISVIGDRPVLVGDVCRFGDRTGTVMHIGLRSTRIRTPERTVISVPNSQFSAVALENISGRDKIWFHPTFSLRRDTSSEQLLQVLESMSQILRGHPRVETGALPVRFVGVGAYSLDIDAAAYVKTSDYDEFLALQQELLLKMLQAVEQAGTALAVPLQESFAPRRSAEA